jgi:hypothetical protein
MKKILGIFLLSVCLLFFFASVYTHPTVKAKEGKQNSTTEKQEPVAPETPTDRLKWPRFIENDKGTLKIYQPQVEQWDKDTIKCHMAIEITLKDKGSPIYGALWVIGTTDTDFEERLVQLANFKVSRIEIPSADPNSIKKLENFINTILLNKTKVISLDRLLASAASVPEAVSIKSIHVNLKPPNIIVTQTPSVLLTIDGDPLLQPIGSTGLNFVANANMDLFYYPAMKKYYLFIGEQWLSASDLKGDWQKNITPPEIFKEIPDDYERAYIKDLIEVKSDKTVAVLLAKPPAELIVIDGAPSMKSMPGTNLMYAANTEQNLFFHRSEGLFYYMSSGRWFRSRRLNGPWVSIGDDLPEGFSKIPDGHPKSSVRVSVPGTPESKEAVIEASIPRKITVDRKKTTVSVTYHGEPKFKPIAKTGMSYAVNTTKDVIRFGNKYYCCFQGVWFVSNKPKGSWKVCDSIPDEIYTIPPDNPKYYVTYVSVYGYDSETVTFGYTAGYTGTYVSGDTVVHGTGYHYPSYVYYHDGYPHYYWYPYTYSYWGYSYYYYGGPYYYYPSYYYGYTTYHQGRYGSGHTYHYGQYSETHYSGNYKGATFETKQYTDPHGHWGETEVRRGDDWAKTWHKTSEGKTVRGIETSKGGKGVGFSDGEHRSSVYRAGDNNLYVGKDGNVYRHDENGWSKREGENWNQISRDQRTPTTNLAGSRDSLKSKRSEVQSKRSKMTGKTESSRKPNLGNVSSKRTGSRSSVSQPRRYGTSARNIKSRSTYSGLQRNRSARSRGSYRTRQHQSRRSTRVSGRRPSGRGGSRGRRPSGRGGARGRR